MEIWLLFLPGLNNHRDVTLMTMNEYNTDKNGGELNFETEVTYD